MDNIKVVIRGLFALLLEMDFDCNMDQFLLTCKVIARLVAACRPSVQLCKIVTIAQLQQLVRLSVWNDQQHPWAVHAITCLLQVSATSTSSSQLDNRIKLINYILIILAGSFGCGQAVPGQ